ncbi:hypothetical protein [Streptomyces sp. cmx-10-25]|uniref:hypothetical protein n=1 Tax=Streptomyces sp. cmx-10-25 TaxID=2790919 RepID=UPI003980A5E7
MTSRRALGAGPQIRAAQADLIAALPGIRLPNLDDLRARGVLGAHPADTSARHRALGTGGHADRSTDEN